MELSGIQIPTSTEEVHRKWLRDCYKHAEHSRHPTTHNAALLIQGEKIVAKGVNNLPPGVEAKPEHLSEEHKHVSLNHAETDAIYNAAREGIATQGLTMVVPWLPCILCTNAIITSGIKRVIVHRQLVERERAKWSEAFSESLQLMHEAGVEPIAFDGVVGVKTLQSGQEWEA